MCTCRVFLIDRTPEGHFGHQAQYNQWFQKALRENNQDFNLIHVINSYQKENYTHQLHSEIRTNQSVTREEILQVKKILDKHQDKFFHLFFTWTKFFTVSDIKHWVNAFQNYDYSIEGLGPSSQWIRNYSRSSAEKNHAFAFAESFGKTRYLSWDSRITQLNDKRFCQIPDYADYVPRVRYPNNSSRPVVGFFGSSSYGRGLTTFLLMVLFNPKVNFIFVGRKIELMKLWRPNRIVIPLSSKISLVLGVLSSPFFLLCIKLPNLNLNYSYPDINELVAIMQKTDVIYFESKNRGESSGIVTHALASGVPVIYRGSNSQILDVLDSKFPFGRSSLINLVFPGRLKNKIRKTKDQQVLMAATWIDFKSIFLDFRCSNKSL
jgi:glycosyltransferase involved in cell wall biosynthesis